MSALQILLAYSNISS